MEVLRPELIWVDGRCYRKLTTKFNTINTSEEMEEEQQQPQKSSQNLEQESKQCSTGDGPCPVDEEAEVQFEEDPKMGSFIKMDVAIHYFRYIIGRFGETKKRIESQTQTTIQVPKINHVGPIIIYGKDKRSILECRRRILSLVDSARQRQEPTHFLSIPFTNDEIRTNFNNFKSQILADFSNCRGITEKAFIEAQKLHLTIGMMVLMSDSERNLVKKVLTDCDKDVIRPFLSNRPEMKYLLKGLDCMNDDPAEVHVLYGKVCKMDGSYPTELQKLVDKILTYFSARNLIVRNFRGESVKMHVTLMNSRYAASDASPNSADDNTQGSSGPGPSWQRAKSNFGNRETFDARKIFNKFGNFEFGIQEIKSLHISQRHAVNSDGYYQPTDKILLSNSA